MPHHFSSGSSGHGLTLVGTAVIVAIFAAGRWLRQRIWPSNDEAEDQAMM